MLALSDKARRPAVAASHFLFEMLQNKLSVLKSTEKATLKDYIARSLGAFFYAKLKTRPSQEDRVLVFFVQLAESTTLPQ